MSRSVWIPLSILLVAFAAPGMAQDEVYDLRRDVPVTGHDLNAVPTITPEMWFYEQERTRHDDPAQAVRRKAELRGQQRAQRLASLKWFGIDNSRPIVSATPAMGGTWAPMWGSNTYDLHRWRPYYSPTAVIVERNGGRY